MSISLSSIAHAAIDQMFAGLDGVLAKAQADAKARDIDETVFLSGRLAPDMFDLTKQVQIATELPARSLSRLAGVGVPDLTGEEKSFDELRALIGKARDHIKSLSNEAIDADPDAPITFPAGADKEMTLPRRVFLQNMILPNLYFHVSMTYAILRHNGVELGKRDFLAVPG